MDCKQRLLVIDDEEDLCDILKFNLECDGYLVDTVHSAEDALQMELQHYDLLLVDIMMGEMSGLKMVHVMQQRAELKDIPFIFISARDTENDTITGFNLGADDYIAKPFSVREVSLRVKAVLRRVAKKKTTKYAPAADTEGKANENLVFQQLQVDLVNKSVWLKGKQLTLTRKEIEILKLLLGHPNHIYSRNDILRMVWDDDVIVNDRTVDVNIARLRKKLGDYGKHILNRSGYGYRWNTEE